MTIFLRQRNCDCKTRSFWPCECWCYFWTA